MTLSLRGVYTFTIGLALLPGFTAAAQEPLMSRAEWTAIRDQASGSAPYEKPPCAYTSSPGSGDG